MVWYKNFTCFLILIFLFIYACRESDNTSIDIDIDIPDDFQLEVLYSPHEYEHGSWVALTEGPSQNLFVSDQYGKVYQFPIPKKSAQIDHEDIKAVDLNIGYAQGLLWAFNSLYVIVVNRKDEENPDDPTSGVYRLRDTNGNGELDTMKKILDLDGEGEHGPHTMRVSPDGESLFLIAGNFNTVPEHFSSRLPRTWAEDNLFPPYLDARGHAVELKAPGGWIAKTDPAGEEWELYAAGFRNPFSFGFNNDDELFAYDADMEWDFGMPWYRPTRILHATSGAEFGWRTGSGKWPVYNPDNLSAVENMAQGSPTAVIMGKDLKFPSKYRNGLFACDWSFGTMYYVDLEEEGSSYIGTKEEFLSGTPLPISNAIAGSDGHLYFTTGGRRLESHLYRLSYTGLEDTTIDLATNTKAEELRRIRKSLESHHVPNSREAVQQSWKYLNHEDENIRHAARIAIEHQPLSSWHDAMINEENTSRFLHACLAYVRSNGPYNNKISNRLNDINYRSNLTDDEQLLLLRVYQLFLIRNGLPPTSVRNAIIKQLNSHFPSKNPRINRELSQVLLYLDAPNAVDQTMKVLAAASQDAQTLQSEILDETSLERSEQYGPQILEMIKNMPPTEAIHYVTILSHVKNGWTKELREKYFNWFQVALQGKGGESYKSFLDNIREKALSNVPADEYKYFQNLAGFYSPMKAMSELPQPVGPGGEYNLYDLGRIVLWGNGKVDNYDGEYAGGLRAYEAALCSTCHRINGDGGSSGPDLTNINTRFTKDDIVKAILSPNEEISDQYAFTLFTKSDGAIVSGRIVEETEEYYSIYQSPYDMTSTTRLAKADIVGKELSALSPMPAKLLNRLNEQEVLDLMVYLLAGGDEKHELYD